MSDNQAKDPENRKEHLTDIIEGFDTAMLVTHDERRLLRARPLSIADHEDGVLWFVTARSSGKVVELEDDARVAIVLQSSQRFVSVSGMARVVDDLPRIKELWREVWRPWFPDGPTDPEIVAVRIEVEAAEFWDLKGLNGLRYMVDGIRALIQGVRASDGAGTRYHGRVGIDDQNAEG